MSDASGIADQIQRLQISKAVTATAQNDAHILTLEYPAVVLLPFWVAPSLPQPANVHQRRQPDPELQPLETEFYAVLKQDATANSQYSALQNPCGGLLQAIESLKGTLGSSCLRMVAFVAAGSLDPEAVTYRFQLVAGPSPYRSAATSLVLYEVDLDKYAWSALLLAAEQESWVRLLQELVNRASDRAWFEVRRRLLELYEREDEAIRQDGFWQDHWHTKPARCATELFKACMRPLYYEDQRKWYDDCDAWLPVEFFACGHTRYVRKIDIMAQTQESCLQVQCNDCSKPIMTTKARRELELRQEVTNRDDFAWKNVMWRSLDNDEDFSNDTKLYEFDSRVILEALDLALKSFVAPRLVSPACLVPTNAFFTEITTIMQHWASVYGRASFEVMVIPATLRFNLYSLAMETETGHGTISTITTLPGFHGFLNAWLIRAVNFLLHRRCGERDYEHEGVHEHDDGWCYFSLSEEEKQFERDVVDVEAMMKDAVLDEEEVLL